MASETARPLSRREVMPHPEEARSRSGVPGWIHVRDNPISTRDPALGAAVERAVGEALKDEDMGPVQVRFSLWRDGSRVLKFVCKVEARGDEASGTPPWRWWSSLTRRPEQLHDALARGLQARRERLGSRALVPLRPSRGC